MAHYAIVVDLDRCIGCHGCEIACKNENNIALGEYWNKVVERGPFGEYPDLEMYFLPTMCQQCADAPCVHVCPTGPPLPLVQQWMLLVSIPHIFDTRQNQAARTQLPLLPFLRIPVGNLSVSLRSRPCHIPVTSDTSFYGYKCGWNPFLSGCDNFQPFSRYNRGILPHRLNPHSLQWQAPLS